MPLFSNTEPPRAHIEAVAQRVGVSLFTNSFLSNGTLGEEEYAPVQFAAKKSSVRSGRKGTAKWEDTLRQTLDWLHITRYLVHWDITHNSPWGEGDVYSARNGKYLGSLCPNTGGVPRYSQIIEGRRATKG